jgi:hypothetical protein
MNAAGVFDACTLLLGVNLVDHIHNVGGQQHIGAWRQDVFAFSLKNRLNDM